MNTRHSRSRCRTFTTASRIAAAAQPMLAVAAGQSAINLAELAHAIAADRNLCCCVTQTAFEEFGWPGLNIEQAIVLLGRERLAMQILRLHYLNNSAAPTENFYPLEPFQGKPE